MHFLVRPSKLQGSITVPPSKSHTLRAILFASIAKGRSEINGYLHSPDTKAMVYACQQLGAEISTNEQKMIISGTGGSFKVPDNVIDVGNSGQVLRFIGAITALLPAYTIITGDQSIRYNRPVQPLIDGLRGLGAFAVSTKEDGCAPVIIKGPLYSGYTELAGEDSQPVSGILIAASLLDGLSQINVLNPGEKPWVDLTLNWLSRFDIKYTNENYTKYTVKGQSNYACFKYTVPGDFSSAAFPIVAALITHSEIILKNLDMHDIQPLFRT